MGTDDFFCSHFAVLEASLRPALRRALDAASTFPLNPSIRPMLVDLLAELPSSIGEEDFPSWRFVLDRRIALTWRHKPDSLSWLEDKAHQVRATAALLAARDPVHMPLLYEVGAPPDKECATKLFFEEHATKILETVDFGTGFFIKPRNGHDSMAASAWTPATLTALQKQHRLVPLLCDALRCCMEVKDRSFERECWGLSEIPSGVVVQPLYASASKIFYEEESSTKINVKSLLVTSHSRSVTHLPCEVKVHVLFGKALGAVLHSHASLVWITAEGSVKLLHSEGPPKRKNERFKLCEAAEVCRRLVAPTLKVEWEKMKNVSEEIARKAGVEELRVDWYIGDDKWKSRVGELTYQGAAFSGNELFGNVIVKTYLEGIRRNLAEKKSSGQG